MIVQNDQMKEVEKYLFIYLFIYINIYTGIAIDVHLIHFNKCTISNTVASTVINAFAVV